MVRLLPMLLLLGADDGDPVGATPPAPPAPATATATAPDPARGEELLRMATEALLAGDYEVVVHIAIPSISEYPELAPSFRAVAEIAIDQQERAFEKLTFDADGDREVYLPGIEPGGPIGGNRDGLAGGVELGLPTGVRVEWRFPRGAVTSIGARSGVSLNWPYGYGMFANSVFADFRIAEHLELEPNVGLTVFSGSVYGLVLLSLQYDPPPPIQGNFGVGIAGSYIAIDATVGFVW